MTIRQAYISTFEATEGMRLARVLRNATRHRLFQLQQGAVLTEELIHQISVRGIQCLVVEEKDTRSAEQIEKDQLRAQQETDSVFRGADLSRPALFSLYDAVLNYRKLHAV